MLEIGKQAPDFEAPATGDQTIRLSSLKGQNVVLYFYPRDNTTNCTLESRSFRDIHQHFVAENTQILGMSKDSIQSHESFATNQNLPYPLLSDTSGDICQTYGVIQEKTLFGRLVTGIERSTFVIDAEGRLVKEYRKVDVGGHAEEVLDFIRALNAEASPS